MICHGFKGGIGTSSRRRSTDGGYTVGVLVQANHGARSGSRRRRSVGRAIGPERVRCPQPARRGRGLDHRRRRDRRAAPARPVRPARAARGFGIARTGGMGENGSGDFRSASRPVTAGSTADGPSSSSGCGATAASNALFYAVIDATEEAIVNALLAAETMTGRGGNTAYALEPDLLSRRSEP